MIAHFVNTLSKDQVDYDDCSLHGSGADEARMSRMGREGEDRGRQGVGVEELVVVRAVYLECTVDGGGDEARDRLAAVSERSALAKAYGGL